jgi:hypothetical protein
MSFLKIMKITPHSTSSNCNLFMANIDVVAQHFEKFEQDEGFEI